MDKMNKEEILKLMGSVNSSGIFNCGASELSKLAIDYRDLTRDKEFLIKAIGVNGLVYRFFCDYECRKDRDIALVASKKSHLDFEYIMEHFPELVDRDFVLETAKVNGRILIILKRKKSEFIRDKEIILESLKSYPEGLKDVDEDIRSSDFDILLAGVKGYSRNIRLGNEALRNNSEIALAGIIQNDKEIEFYSPEGKQRYSIWNDIGEELRNNPEFIAKVEEARKRSPEEEKERNLLHTIASYAEAAAQEAQDRADMNTYGSIPPEDGISEAALGMLHLLSTKTLENLPSCFGRIYRNEAKKIIALRRKEASHDISEIGNADSAIVSKLPEEEER